MPWGDRKAYERIRDEEEGRSESWSERPAPALHQPKLTIQTSGRGRHDENDLKIAQRLVDLEARVVTLEALDKNKTKWLEALDEFRTNTIEDINELSRAADDDASEWEDDENPTFIAAALFPKSLPSTRIRIHLMKFNRPANEAEALSRAQSWADSEDGTMVTVQRLR